MTDAHAAAIGGPLGRRRRPLRRQLAEDDDVDLHRHRRPALLRPALRLRLPAHGEPRALAETTEVFSIPFIALMTFILITSSTFMGTAVTAARLGDRKKALLNLVLTIVGGAAFLGCQAYEWSHLIHEGARLTSNPWGAPQFGPAFFVLTGFHGSHVFSGLVILIITAIRTAHGQDAGPGRGDGRPLLALRRPRLGLHLHPLLPAPELDRGTA